MAKTLWYLPLEPIENRYTKEWWTQFDEVFKEEHINVVKIPSKWPIVKTDGKNFLDWGNSFAFKFNQLSFLFKNIKDGDIVFVADGEFPGLESLEYYRKLNHINFKIYSIWHAGTYDVQDLTYKCGLEPIGKPLENILFNICDKVFLASEQHKKLILSKRKVPASKLVVTGLPLDTKQLSSFRDKAKIIDRNKIIFGGRLVDEKGYDIVQQWIKQGYNIDVALTKGYTKTEWHKKMAEAGLVFVPSLQETFGYNSTEALAMGVPLVVSNAEVFREYVPKTFIVKSHTANAYAKKIDEVMSSEYPISVLRESVAKYDYHIVIKRMLREMGL